MKIDGFRSDVTSADALVAATVTWEDSERSTQEIFFRTDAQFAEDFSCDPRAFLLACFAPALRHGERRIVIAAEIDAELYDGLQAAASLLQLWSGRDARPVQIEATSVARGPSIPPEERAASFLSGGVDSLASLRANRLAYPSDHPRHIKDCFVGNRFETRLAIGDVEQLAPALCDVAQDTGVTLIPFSTNVKDLDPDRRFWMLEFHGAVLAAVAHTFSHRVTRATIASSLYRFPTLIPWGSHPLLDPLFGSTDLRIHHDGIRLSRLAKVRLIADWDVGLQSLRVCTGVKPGRANCGRCAKCVRTMTELLAIGALERCRAFEANDVSVEMLDRTSIKTEYRESLDEVIQPLEDLGRVDLVDAIRRKAAEYGRYLAWEEDRGWRGAVNRVGRRIPNTLESLRSLDQARDVRRLPRGLRRRLSSISGGRDFAHGRGGLA